MTSPRTSSRPRLGRLARRTATLLGTVAFAGAAGTLVWLGAERIAANASVSPETTARPPLPVETAPLVPSAFYEEVVQYPGRVETRQRVGLGFETGGTLAEVTVDEGAVVGAGAVIARLDTRALEAERAAQAARIAALEAERELARLTADRQRELLERKQVSAQRHDEARLAVARIEAEIAAARAGLAGIDVALDKSVIRAPFDGRVAARFADTGARLGGGAPVVDLLEAGAMQFRAGVPVETAATLAAGDRAEVEIGGRTVTATVARIRADVDPATRTRDVILSLPGDAAFAEAALGTLALRDRVAQEGVWVPAAALVEGVRGLWTLYLVEETGDGPRARREAVELLHSDGARAYVRGAFGGAGAVVAAGPHRIADGQAILPGGTE